MTVAIDTRGPFSAGRKAGREERARLSADLAPIIPAYLAARQEAADWRHMPIMSDSLTRANRRARAFAIGYLHGFREEN